jgi:tetratricopeptide (TPR) repeat protein
LGRRGAGRLSDTGIDARNSVGAADRDTRPAPPRDEDRWERVDDVRSRAAGAVSRGRKPVEREAVTKERRGRPPRKAGAGSAGAEAKGELVKALGAARGARANERLRDAAFAFERERFEEARTLLKPLAEQAPQAASVRELLGLTYYRLGRWKDAVRELEAFRQATGETDQHPVLADAYRALKRHREVEDLWEELRDASPAADLVTEGRIVMAGSMADRGDLAGAIALLEKSQRGIKRAQVHHLRQGYALADLYERAGDVARARELFRWVTAHEPEFADAAERASSLG